MCGLGHHQIDDDVPVRRTRERRRRPVQSRKEQRAVQLRMSMMLADELQKLPAGQAKAQDEFAEQYELIPPGLDQISDHAPSADTRPYWARDND